MSPSALTLFRRRPIRQKVALLIAISSLIGLGLAGLAVLVYELTTSRPRALRDASTQAAIVRVNTIPALLFGDSAAAAENLATLRTRREVGAAAIWRTDGRLFASYHRPGGPPLPVRAPTQAGSRFTGNQLVLAQPLASDHELIGWLTLQYEMPPLLERLAQYGIMVAVVVLALGTAAILLLGMLGTGVTTPLARLTGTARSIAASRDYGIRIPAGPPDEIGALTEAWNEMLGTIEQSQDALQTSELRLRLALEAAVMSTVDAELEPRERRDTIVAALLKGVHPDDRLHVERVLNGAIENRGRVEVEYRESNGENRWRALRGQVSPDGSRLMGVTQDVTQRRRLELQLLEAQKMEAIGNLAGGIAHDFNNLLTGIIGYLRFVQRALPEGTQLRGDVDEAERAAERAAELTSQLLSYARRQMVVPTVVDLTNAVHSLQPMLHRLLREDVEMVVESEPDLWLTRIDPNQIDRVLLNLAVNACDAMPKGGKLRIGLRNVQLDGRAPELQETDLPAGDYVELTVSDSGVGIPPDVLPRIFEPFFTTKPVGAGTGLGLAMCYGVVKQANGTIRVTSRPGAGTTFTVLLPRTEASSPETVVEGEADAFPGGTETVLVVEDNDMVRGMASRALRGAGYHVLQAEDGEAALECAERYAGEIHLLLADVVMPGLSGPELAEQLMAVRPGTRILFMSGYTEETAVRRGIEEGKATFIAKPFTPAAIARAVRAALDGKSV